MRARSAVLFSWLIVTGTAAATEIEGRFTIGEEAIEPRHGTALQLRRGASELTTTILLSELPADAAAAVTALDPLTALMNQPGLRDANFITLSVARNGTVTMNATFSDGMRQYVALSGDVSAEWTERSDTRLAGRVFTPAPIATRDSGSYSLDVRFDVSVVQRKGGTPLASDGGEPGRVLVALLEALDAGDFEAIRSHVNEELAADFDASYNTPEENLESARQRFSGALPKRLGELRGGIDYGDEAIVELSGQVYEDMQGLFRVRLVQRDGRWVFDAGLMVGLLD